jgi:hypothetical protein
VRVAETAGTNPTGVSWSDRLFDAIPVAPAWIGAGIAIGLLALFVLLSAAFGGLSDFLAGHKSFWEQRDARLSVVLVILAAFVITAERYARIGAKRNFAALLRLLDVGEAQSLARRFERVDARRRRAAGWLGLLLAPTAGLAIDRDPGLYLLAGYWHAENTWAWIVGALFCIGLGRFVDTTLVISRCFSELARGIPRVDLFDLAPLAPFGRQGLLFALLWLLMPSIFALNAMDRSFELPIVLLALISIAIATTALLLPGLGVHRRIREAKVAELARVMAGIRGEPGALAGSAIARREGSASLADLVAWKTLVDSVSEWPLDAGMRLRFLLYLAIPVGSWVGGALVDRLLNAALG